MTVLFVVVSAIALWWWSAKHRKKALIEAVLFEGSMYLKKFRHAVHGDSDYFDVSGIDPEFQYYVTNCLEDLAYYVREGNVPSRDVEDVAAQLRLIGRICAGTVPETLRISNRLDFIDGLFPHIKSLADTPRDSLFNPVTDLKRLIPLGRTALKWKLDGRHISRQEARHILEAAKERIRSGGHGTKIATADDDHGAGDR